jgi:TPR repeat protein
LEYLQLAKLGDVDAMMTVAEVQFSKNGYGQISYNPVQARRWLEYAATKGDMTAIATLKHLAQRGRQQKLLSEQVKRYQVHNLENPKLGPGAAEQIDELTRTGKHAANQPKLKPLDGKDIFTKSEMMATAMEQQVLKQQDSRRIERLKEQAALHAKLRAMSEAAVDEAKDKKEQQ